MWWWLWLGCVPSAVEPVVPEPVAVASPEPGAGNLRALLDEPERALGTFRAMRHRGPDGPVDGYYISGIRQGSLPARLGFRNDDIVHDIGGHPVRSKHEVLAALRSVRNVEQVTVLVTRDQTLHPLTFRLDDAVPPPGPPATVRELLQRRQDHWALGTARLHIGPDGACDGFRMSGISAGTIAARLGLDNGMVVHRANGLPLTSWVEAIQAYETLKGVGHITFSYRLRGEDGQLTIALDEPVPSADAENTSPSPGMR